MKVTPRTLDTWFGSVTPHLLRSELPSSKEEYWNETITTNARTDHRKAKKLGYLFNLVGKVPHDDLVDIYESYGGDLKQGRPINKRYNAIDFAWHDIGPDWPVDDYTPYTNVRDGDYSGGLHMFSIISPSGKHVALGEMVVWLGGVAVHAFMGHKDHLKNGIMKLLLVEIALYYISKNCKKIFYGDGAFLEDNRKYFMRDLGFSKNG